MNAKDAIRDLLSDEPVGSAGYRKALDGLRDHPEEALDALDSLEDPFEIAGDESTRERRSADFHGAFSEKLGGGTQETAAPEHDPFADEKHAMAAELETWLAEIPGGWRSLVERLDDLERSDRLGDDELARFRREPDVAAWPSQAAEALILRPDGIAQRHLRIVGVDAIVPVLASRAEVSAGVAAKLYEWFCFAQRYSASMLPGVTLTGGESREGSDLIKGPNFRSLRPPDPRDAAVRA